MDFKIHVWPEDDHWHYIAHWGDQISVRRDLDCPLCDTKEEAYRLAEEDLKKLGGPGRLYVDQFMNCWYWLGCIDDKILVGEVYGNWQNTNKEAQDAGVAWCKRLGIQIEEIISADID